MKKLHKAGVIARQCSDALVQEESALAVTFEFRKQRTAAIALCVADSMDAKIFAAESALQVSTSGIASVVIIDR